jgi:hypothetical protein
MRKKAQKLTLYRITLRQLDDLRLRGAEAAPEAPGETEDRRCEPSIASCQISCTVC